MGKQRKADQAQLLLEGVRAGDHVLMGGSYASSPWHWYSGVVLWADKRTVLIERANSHGDTWRECYPVEEIRAFSPDIAELVAIKKQACNAVLELHRAVGEAEQALGHARDAEQQKVEELARGGLKISPVDRQAIEATRARDRTAQEQAESEQALEAMPVE